MAIALVSSTQKAGTASGLTTTSIDTTGATLIVICMASYGASAVPTVSDSKSNTWITRTSYTPGGDTTRHTIAYCENPTVGSGHTFTLSGSGIYPAAEVRAFSGTLTASSYDTENGTSTSSGVTSQAVGSVTPAANGEVLVAGWSLYGGITSPSVNSGFTLGTGVAYGAGSNFGLQSAYLIQTSAAAVNPTLSWTSSVKSASSIATFKPLASGLLVPRGFNGGFVDKFVGGFAG